MTQKVKRKCLSCGRAGQIGIFLGERVEEFIFWIYYGICDDCAISVNISINIFDTRCLSGPAGIFVEDKFKSFLPEIQVAVTRRSRKILTTLISKILPFFPRDLILLCIEYLDLLQIL